MPYTACLSKAAELVATPPMLVQEDGQRRSHLLVLASFRTDFFSAGTFESIFLSPGEVHRPLVPKKLLAIYRRGACFGESELLHGTSRSTTVVCNSIGLIACISQRDYLVCTFLLLYLLPLSAVCINVVRLCTSGA